MASSAAGGAFAGACGGAGSDGGTEHTGGPVVALELVGSGGQGRQDAATQVARDFDRHSAGRYRLAATIVAAAYLPKLTAMFASDTAPDVFMTTAQVKVEWVTKNLLLDLTARIKRSKSAGPGLYLQPMLDAMTWQGKLWGTAQDFNGLLLYLNQDAFEERRLPLPGESWTMDEYRALARQLTDPSKPAFGTNNLAYDDGKLNFALLWNYGKHFWVSDDFKKSLVASPASLQLHQYFADLQYKDRSAPSPDNPLPPGIGNAQGAVAMFRGWGNDIFSFVQTAEKEGRRMFAWKPMLVPKGPQDQKTFSHGHLWSVPRATRRPDAAWAAAEWAGGVEGWKVWNATRQAPLALKDASLWKQHYSFLPPEQASTMIDFITRKLYAGAAFNFQYWPTYSDCLAVMTAAQVAMYRQNASVKTTLEEAARAMDAILQK